MVVNVRVPENIAHVVIPRPELYEVTRKLAPSIVKVEIDDSDTPKAPCPAYIPATTYFVNAEPASLSEAGPSAT